jgi:glutamine synthetase
MEQFKDHDPWVGIEQEYTLMRPGKVGEASTMPLGFNEDGSEPAPQGPYYCSAGTGSAIGRTVADDHYTKCLAAGVKIAGTNAEVMPGQWEYQVGPCRGIEMGDHLHMARYIMLRITEKHNVICSISPKPRDGDWNGAGCHTNFSTEGMRQPGGYSNIIKVCEAFGPVAAEHIALYGEGNDKRLTGKHETCSINQFKFGVADRGASIRIPREAEKNGCGYMEDRRPAANCDPYAVTYIVMKTAGAALPPPPPLPSDGTGLPYMTSYKDCVLAEYVWLDAHQVPRSKTMTMPKAPSSVDELRIWNYDGSSTEQAEGHNSEIFLHPRCIFKDPFRGAPHIIVLAEAYNAWDNLPTIGNTRAKCAEIMAKYPQLDPWFGIEQEYTLMKPGKVGELPTQPIGFNDDGSEPAPQGPYYCSAGTGCAIGRAVADDHYEKCKDAGVKIAGTNAEVMPGQWEYQVGPCRGIEMGDHLTLARYIMLRVTETHKVICSISPKPKEGDWNGAGCHTNFSTAGMRAPGGYSEIIKVCEAFGPVAADHIAVYGEGNDKRLTGKHETCSINQFKYGVANRGASIRIPRDAEKNGCGYMEDRRPAANCDPYAVTHIIMKTTGEALSK